MTFIVEKDWEHDGLRCVAIRIMDSYKGHRCGYVGVPSTHPLYGAEYSAECEALAAAAKVAEQGPIGNRGILSVFCSAGEDGLRLTPGAIFDVHGSLTFSGGQKNGKNHPVDCDLWFFGFDCAHYGDDEEGGKPLIYVISECESLATQLAALTK